MKPRIANHLQVPKCMANQIPCSSGRLESPPAAGRDSVLHQMNGWPGRPSMVGFLCFCGFGAITPQKIVNTLPVDYPNSWFTLTNGKIRKTPQHLQDSRCQDGVEEFRLWFTEIFQANPDGWIVFQGTFGFLMPLIKMGQTMHPIQFQWGLPGHFQLQTYRFWTSPGHHNPFPLLLNAPKNTKKHRSIFFGTSEVGRFDFNRSPLEHEVKKWRSHSRVSPVSPPK